MDKQARLTAVEKAIKETYEAIDQARYGAGTSLASREYHYLVKCAEKLVYLCLALEDLSIEAQSLRDDIDSDSKTDL